MTDYKAKCNVLLIGGGGVGAIAALNLESGGLAAVTAVLRSNYKPVVDNGFSITSCDHGSYKAWRPTQVVDGVPPASSTAFDFIVCTTKAIPGRSPSLTDIIAPAVIPGHTVIVLIQNGLNIEKPVFQAFPNNVVLSGVSLISSQEVSHGVIEHVGHDILFIGAFRNLALSEEAEMTAALRFIKVYSAAGRCQCEHEPNVPLSRWRKLIYNTCLNSICAITGLDTGRLQLEQNAVQTLVRPAMQEVRAAAKAAGVNLPDDIVDTVLHEIEPIDMEFPPSMLVDVRKGNLTEFENIVGEPLREGTARDVPMPTVKVLYHILKAMQWRTMESNR